MYVFGPGFNEVFYFSQLIVRAFNELAKPSNVKSSAHYDKYVIGT